MRSTAEMKRVVNWID